MAKFLSTSRDIPAVSLAQLYPNNTNMDRLLSVSQMPSTDSPQSDTPVIAFYNSSTAITTAWYKDFAKGSVIFDAFGATPAVYIKTAVHRLGFQLHCHNFTFCLTSLVWIKVCTGGDFIINHDYEDINITRRSGFNTTTVSR